MPPVLKDSDVLRLQRIGSTKMRSTDEAANKGTTACWSWTLYAGAGGKDDDPAPMFASASHYPQLKAYKAQLRASASSEISDSTLRTWALNEGRELDKGNQSVGETAYNIVAKAVELAGLTIADEEDTDYFICMHFPHGDGVSYTHWWLEVYGYCIEMWPAINDVYIYQKPEEPESYTRIRVPVEALHTDHITRIVNTLDYGKNCRKAPGGYS